MDRQSAFELMCQYTENESLRRHMRCVEIAMEAYATSRADELGLSADDIAKWGVVGLLHDFDYEQNPTAPDHPLVGSKILADNGYPEDVIYAIKSHVDDVNEVEPCPRVSPMDKTLFAVDELCGFITAVALMRPTKIVGMKSKSVRKKMKQKSFAEKVSRDDIVNGAEELGVDLNTHIQFVIDALSKHAQELELDSVASV